MKLFNIVFLSFLFSITLYAQNIVSDTIYIEFQADTLIPTQVYANSFADLRDQNPNLVSYTKRRKFIFIPVDQQIYLREPLSINLKNSLNYSSPKLRKDTLDLEIKHFLISKYKGRFFSYYLLEADINLIKQDSINGTLCYNYKYSPKKKRTATPILCENILSNWHRDFKVDLLAANSYLKNSSNPKPDNFIVEQIKRPSFFSVTASTIAGLDFWQLEAEIYFTRIETNEPRIFQAGIIRYQNTKEFEAISFGKRAFHYNTRINNNLLFDLNTNFLIGINKWRNTDDIKLQQVLQASFSSTQSLNFDRKNKAGWILKTGLFENFYYILEKSPKIQFGIYLSTGYKF